MYTVTNLVLCKAIANDKSVIETMHKPKFSTGKVSSAPSIDEGEILL